VDAEEQAKISGIKIFSADIIYHLFDQFVKYKQVQESERKLVASNDMVYPCVLEILPKCIFNNKNPIILGVDVIEGNLHIGTQLVIHSNSLTTNSLYIGKVISIQSNNKDVKRVICN
jgi:translation initiation factor 5B